MSDFLIHQLDYILFVCGLSCLAFGVVCRALDKQDRALPWGWLAPFGFFCGTAAWLDIAPVVGCGCAWLPVVRMLVSVVAFALLVEFGRLGLLRTGGRAPGRWALLLLMALTLPGMSAGPSGVELLAQYTLAVPGYLLAAWVLLRAARSGGSSGHLRTLGGIFIFAALMEVLPFSPLSNLAEGHYIQHSGLDALIALVRTVAAVTALAVVWRCHESVASAPAGCPSCFRIRSIGAAAVAAVVAAGWLITHFTGAQADALLRGNLLSRTISAATCVDQRGIAGLSGSDRDVSSPAFIDLRRSLQAIHAANPDARYVYAMGRRGGRIVFLADAEPEHSADYSPPGEVYGGASPELRAAFRTGAHFVEGPVRDQWGSFVSGLAPVMPRGSDTVVAILGMDVDASDWGVTVGRCRLFCILITLLMCGVVTALVQLMWKREALNALALYSEMLYHSVVDGSPTWVSLLDADGRVLSINRSGLTITGWTESDVCGKHFSELWPERERGRVRSKLRRVLDGSRCSFDASCRTAAGDPLDWYVVVSPIEDPRQRVGFYVCVAVDVTDRTVAEKALERRHDMESMVARISFSAIAVDDLDSFQERSLRLVGETLGLSRVLLYARRGDSLAFDPVCVWPPAEQSGLAAPSSFDGACAWAEDLRSGRIVSLPDVSSAADEDCAALGIADVRSVLAVPLLVGRRFHGFLRFDDCRGPRDWPEEDVDILDTVAQILCGVLEHGQAQSALRIQNTAINAASDQIVITDSQGVVEFVNPAFERETGYSAEEVLGQTLRLLRSGRHNRGFYAEMWRTILSGITWHGEITNRRKDGSLYTDDVTITPVSSLPGKIEHFIAIKRNVTDKKMYEERLDHLAHHDSLTELPNRLLFSDRLNQMLTQARRAGTGAAVMFIDLDRFKLINDSLGHAVGDQVLKAVASRLREALRGVDTIARMGGDEFTIIVSDIEGPDEASVVAQKVLQALAPPVQLEDREVFMSASIGISMYPTDGGDVESLVRSADAAMYRAKDSGRNNFQFAAGSHSDAMVELMTLESDLRRAVARGEFVVHYQPRVDIRTGRIVGAEALVRWRHPELGLVLPGVFLGLAEETGLIEPISDFVLRSACEQGRAWSEAGHPPMDIAVNLSPRQFRLGTEALIARVLRETGFDPRRLDLDITESALTSNADRSGELLSRLKEMGVRVSVDDFGTGYSTLAYLKKLPVDAVKIDRSFIKDIDSDSDAAAIAAAVVAMAHSLKLTVIAEGVETLEQLELLRSVECDEMQGYFVSPPLPPEEFECLLLPAPGRAA